MADYGAVANAISTAQDVNYLYWNNDTTTLHPRNLSVGSTFTMGSQGMSDILISTDGASTSNTALVSAGYVDAHGGGVSTSGSPVANDFAKFTAAAVIEGRSYTETRSDLGLVIGTNVLAQQTIGIANDNLMEVDDADAADNDYAKFTAAGLEGRSYSEVKTDLSLNNVENTALSTWAGTTNITTLGAVTATTAISQGTLTTSGALNMATDDSAIQSAGTDVLQVGSTYGITMQAAFGIKNAVAESQWTPGAPMSPDEWQISTFEKIQMISTQGLFGTAYQVTLPAALAGMELMVVYNINNINAIYTLIPSVSEYLYSGGSSVSSITYNKTIFETIHVISPADGYWAVVTHT
jgi:hypothetical protein